MNTNHTESKHSKVTNRGYWGQLTSLPGAPSSLYIRGALPSERMASIAIVGSRRPSAYGREVTYRLAYELARQGIVIISGLALGIDAIAHQAALDAGGRTIAVLGGGLGTIYPRTNQRLAEQILASGGALISEYPDTTPPFPSQFLARNRIISGLSDGVVVTEATARSGTLSTVNHALEQGREVFGVPGNITSLLSAGPNHLISQGARIVMSAEDILAELAPALVPEPMEQPAPSSGLEARIIQLIGQGGGDEEALLQASGVAVSELDQALTMLELTGRIYRVDSTRWALRP